MSPDHLKLINEFIREKGNDIQDILPKLPGHPIRQAQAHLSDSAENLAVHGEDE